MMSHTNVKYFTDIQRKGLKILLERSMISNSNLLKIIDIHCKCFIEKQLFESRCTHLIRFSYMTIGMRMFSIPVLTACKLK